MGAARLARRALVTATACVLGLCIAAAPAAAKKKKKKPAPAPAATATVELDAPPPQAAPAPAPAPGAAPAAPAAPAAAPAAEASAPAAAAPAPAASKAAAASDSDDTYDPLGAKHTLVLDDLSGFRASTVGGVGYAGPLGFATQSNSVNVFGASGTAAGTDTVHSTTIWFAPSADYFLFDHISVGAVLELAYATSSYDQSIYGTSTQSHSLPSTTSFTFIPRAGYMFGLAKHWGLWPRVGMGLGVLQQNAVSQAGAGNPTSASSSATFLMDLDLGVLYRLDPRFYLRAGPDFTWGPGANLTDFSFAGGFGYMWGM